MSQSTSGQQGTLSLSLQATFSTTRRGSQLAVGDLNHAAWSLATMIAIADALPMTARWEGRGKDETSRLLVKWLMGGRGASTRIKRLRYESPLEMALVVAPAVFASLSTLAALIFAVKRMYSLDLEIRTNREEHRAAFWEAKQRADQAELAWLAGRDPEFWPPGVLEALIQTVEYQEHRAERLLQATEILLIDDDGSPPEPQPIEDD